MKKEMRFAVRQIMQHTETEVGKSNMDMQLFGIKTFKSWLERETIDSDKRDYVAAELARRTNSEPAIDLAGRPIPRRPNQFSPLPVR